MVSALRSKFALNEVLPALCMPRSSYQYQVQVEASRRPDKHADLRVRVTEIFRLSKRRYGYRRVWLALRAEGTTVSEKVVCRIMKGGVPVAKRGKRRKYSSYRGEIAEVPDNLVKREFRVDAPNKLWLTDVTEFRIPAGKVYPLPIIDCFDGMVVSWSTSTSPNARMANSMLEAAVGTLSGGEVPTIRSDRGCRYRWPGLISICKESGITHSMSKKGCSPTTPPAGAFFGRMKVEMFYGESWLGYSVDEFMDAIDDCIRWYNETRIKSLLGGLSPTGFRSSLGLAA